MFSLISKRLAKNQRIAGAALQSGIGTGVSGLKKELFLQRFQKHLILTDLLGGSS